MVIWQRSMSTLPAHKQAHDVRVDSRLVKWMPSIHLLVFFFFSMCGRFYRLRNPMHSPLFGACLVQRASSLWKKTHTPVNVTHGHPAMHPRLLDAGACNTAIILEVCGGFISRLLVSDFSCVPRQACSTSILTPRVEHPCFPEHPPHVCSQNIWSGDIYLLPCIDVICCGTRVHSRN